MEGDALLPEILHPQRGGEHILAGVVEDQHLPHQRRLGAVVERRAGRGRAGERAGGRRRGCRRRVVEVKQREERMRLCVQQGGAGHCGGRWIEKPSVPWPHLNAGPSRWHWLRNLQSSGSMRRWR